MTKHIIIGTFISFVGIFLIIFGLRTVPKGQSTKPQETSKETVEGYTTFDYIYINKKKAISRDYIVKLTEYLVKNTANDGATYNWYTVITDDNKNYPTLYGGLYRTNGKYIIYSGIKARKVKHLQCLTGFNIRKDKPMIENDEED